MFAIYSRCKCVAIKFPLWIDNHCIILYIVEISSGTLSQEEIDSETCCKESSSSKWAPSVDKLLFNKSWLSYCLASFFRSVNAKWPYPSKVTHFDAIKVGNSGCILRQSHFCKKNGIQFAYIKLKSPFFLVVAGGWKHHWQERRDRETLSRRGKKLGNASIENWEAPLTVCVKLSSNDIQKLPRALHSTHLSFFKVSFLFSLLL